MQCVQKWRGYFLLLQGQTLCGCTEPCLESRVTRPACIWSQRTMMTTSLAQTARMTSISTQALRFRTWTTGILSFTSTARIQASAVEPVVSTLVLTDTDFGEAYLTKRWAAEFVSNLMDRYTVVFVGYSMADVVVRYLTRAVTNRSVDARTYSLVGYRDENQREQRELKWSKTGIHPILYPSGNNHELLVRTVEEWAKLAADPHQYRVQFALSGLKRAPDKKTHEADPDRVVWALSNPAATWPAFNRIRRTPVPGAYAAGWASGVRCPRSSGGDRSACTP